MVEPNRMHLTRIVREFGGVRIDTVDWPILLVEYPESRFLDSELESSLAWLEHIMHACLEARTKCVQITDLTRVRYMPPATQRQFAGQWLKRNLDLIQRTSIGGTTITPSALLRGIVTAVYWFQRPPTRTEFFATRSEAVRCAIDWLEQEMVPLGPRVTGLRDGLMKDEGHAKRPSRFFG